ncbi:MAG: protein kinase [Deltaproteobacteria bacterium]|nr:protein kinase [Deltaproteobacteria bacterium]
MASFEPKPFGKYFLTEKLAIGGMAEIYKAKTFGVDGFEKLLAIKKILPHYSADKEFIAMLTDEAKLVVRLSHTNIVQIYDLGKVGDDYYISMEYIDGLNLREVINRGKELGEKIPLSICLYIISEVAKGLDYAHSKRNDQGEPLHIVHRDISPQNVLISFEGETKIVDFGIAKAAMNVSHTTSGILKGKVTYMSPEQALGMPVDAQTDIFSAGLLLYELLSGERLFSGDSHLEILKKIRTTQISEATFPSSIAAHFRPILSKALAYGPKNRYETAGDFQIALTKLLYSEYNDFSPRQLASLIKKWFAPELKIKKRKAEDDVSESLRTQALMVEPQSESILVASESHNETEVFFQDTTKPESSLTPSQFYHGFEKQPPKKPFPIKKASLTGPMKGILAVVALLLLAGGVFSIYRSLKKSPPPPIEGTETLTNPPYPPFPKGGETEEAKIPEEEEIQPVEPEKPIVEELPPPVIKPQPVTVEPQPVAVEPQPEVKPEVKPDIKLEPVEEPKKKTEPKPVETAVKKIEPVEKSEAKGGAGEVRFDSNPRGAGVVVDGKKAGITPVLLPRLSRDTSHTVVLTLPGYKNWTKSFKLSQNRLEFMAQMERE